VSTALDPARDALQDGLVAMGLDLGSESIMRLLRYTELLTRWNRRFNLTGTRAPEQIISRHLLDSLSVVPHLRGDRVLDAGTGAGLPGLILAIARPQVQFTLLDSAGKKTRFCIQAAAELGLGNVAVERDRLEAFEPQQRFSCLVSRAFESAAELLKPARRLLQEGGLLIVMKGTRPQSELQALAAAGFRARAIPVSVPGLAAARHLLLVEAP
jgi:16S rRNA (guanine527-N7)-methyltransferase